MPESKVQVKVWLTPAERDFLRLLAVANGVSMSAAVSHLLAHTPLLRDA